MRSLHLSRPFRVSLLAFAVVAAILAAVSPWIGDDGAYMQNFYTLEPIASLGDVWQSQVGHYFVQNGRFFVHFILQAMFLYDIPKWLFGLITGGVMAALLLLIERLGGGNWRSARRFIIVASLASFIIFRNGLQPNLMLNYPFAAAMCLAATFLLFKGERRVPGWALPLVGIFAFFAGECHEGFSLPFAVAMLVWALYRPLKRITPMQWAIGIGFALGTCCVTLAPATFSRADSYHTLSSPLRPSHLIGVFIPLVLACWQLASRHTTLRRIWQQNFFWIIVIAVNVAINAKVGIYTHRQLIPAELAALIFALRLLPEIKFPKWLIAATCSFMLIYCVLIGRNWMLTSKAVDDIEQIFMDSHNPLIFYDLPNTPGVLARNGQLDPCGNYHSLYGVHAMWTGYRDEFPMQVLPTAFRDRYNAPEPLTTGVVEWEPKKLLFIRAAGDPKVEFNVAYDICIFGIKLFTNTKRFRIVRSDYGPYKADFQAIRLNYPFVKNIRVKWHFIP